MQDYNTIEYSGVVSRTCPVQGNHLSGQVEIIIPSGKSEAGCTGS